MFRTQSCRTHIATHTHTLSHTHKLRAHNKISKSWKSENKSRTYRNHVGSCRLYGHLRSFASRGTWNTMYARAHHSQDDHHIPCFAVLRLFAFQRCSFANTDGVYVQAFGRPSLQAIRAETMVDGLPRASKFHVFFTSSLILYTISISLRQSEDLLMLIQNFEVRCLGKFV